MTQLLRCCGCGVDQQQLRLLLWDPVKPRDWELLNAMGRAKRKKKKKKKKKIGVPTVDSGLMIQLFSVKVLVRSLAPPIQG